MSLLELSLAFAALLIGITGAWSPCGFSMVETIGLAGEPGRRWTVRAACATFVPGAVAGGIATFGLLAVLGDVVHGVGGTVLYSIAGAIAIAAAAAEARGVRIAPQIRRQLPESWRWTMPLPLASALYGVLLGLGFTTFVLSLGVWALAGISFAVGDPWAGLVIGVAFGVGRAIPVLVVAPVVDRPFGVRCVELMAERPVLYRRARLGDALALTLCAVTLGATGIAAASHTAVRNGADPSAAGKALAWQKGDRGALLRFHGHAHSLPGRDPAIGGKRAATISGGTDQILILNRFSRQVVGTIPAPNAQAVAVDNGWIAWLKVADGRDTLLARRISNAAAPGPERQIAQAGGSSQIGHPSIDGGRVFYALAKRRVNMIKRASLGTGHRKVVLRSRRVMLSNPAVLGKRLVYVQTRRARESPQATHAPRLIQHLMIKPIKHGRAGRRVFAIGKRRRLWTTSLSGKKAYVTITGGKSGARIAAARR